VWVAGAARDYRSIRGSAGLSTASSRADPDLASAEALAPGDMRRVGFQGEWLGAARVRARFAALPLDAFDRVGDVLAAEEQGAYFQLLRLSFGEGRNFCRTPKRGLQLRLKLSERRLHRVLDELVAHGFLRPLHRDNRGTLWRVYLPREAFGEPLGNDVLLGRASPGVPRDAANAVKPAPRPSPVVVLARDRDAPAPTVRVEDLARQLAEARDEPDGMDRAAADIAELLADGASPRQVEACIAAARRARGGRPS
jgi:hypothetical protein